MKSKETLNCSKCRTTDFKSCHSISCPMRKKPKQETIEKVRAVKRTELYNSILSIVKQIPRKEVEGDAMDATSCAYEIEQLFYKFQTERMYSEAEVIEILTQRSKEFGTKNEKFQELLIKQDLEWFEQFKQKKNDNKRNS